MRTLHWEHMDLSEFIGKVCHQIKCNCKALRSSIIITVMVQAQFSLFEFIVAGDIQIGLDKAKSSECLV